MNLKELAGRILFYTFMNTWEEWHAFVEGISDGFCLWQSRHDLVDRLLKDLEGEHHYYAFGRSVGFAGIIILISGMVVWIAGVI